MSNFLKSRQCIPLSEDYFCDGPYYVITSISLGGSDLSPQEVSTVLRQENEPEIKNLLHRGVCLPLFFPGDCAFDDAIIVLGNLTEQEANEWIGRISWKLNIPCGKLVILCGGGDPQEFEYAVSGNPPEEHYEIFQVIDVPPGEYLVEIYAYVSSMTVNVYFEEDESLEEWFQRTRPGMELPPWLQSFKEEGMVWELENELVNYLVRLAPLQTAPPLPKLIDGMGWCGEFEFRRPELCPLGIERSAILDFVR
jgi:hypothetical protein